MNTSFLSLKYRRRISLKERLATNYIQQISITKNTINYYLVLYNIYIIWEKENSHDSKILCVVNDIFEDGLLTKSYSQNSLCLVSHHMC